MSQDLVPYRPRSLTRTGRQEAAAVRAAQLPAKCAAARLQASALVAHVGIAHIELLTTLEVQAVKRQGAVVDGRVAAVVDTFSGAVNTELALLSLGGE